MSSVTGSVVKLRRLQELCTRMHAALKFLCETLPGLPELAELEELVPWALENEDPPPAVAASLRGVLTDLHAFQAFVKVATRRTNPATGETVATDGDLWPVVPPRGR